VEAGGALDVIAFLPFYRRLLTATDGVFQISKTCAAPNTETMRLPCSSGGWRQISRRRRRAACLGRRGVEPRPKFRCCGGKVLTSTLPAGPSAARPRPPSAGCAHQRGPCRFGSRYTFRAILAESLSPSSPLSPVKARNDAAYESDPRRYSEMYHTGDGPPGG
jgi:hypothetical protein